ncbi:MAG: hypothetical protein JW700_01750 [Candidatus Aenigmarchaeota archaeon]|nr:hypothetical protein [Candidatus Aenigmarchaeota archaeon]
MKYFWVAFGLVALVSVIQLFTQPSLEITVMLFLVNFMILGAELMRNRAKKAPVMLKLESIEMNLNDATSSFISPSLKAKGREILDWLNKF